MSCNILIVDDKVENLNLLIDILKDQGYIVRPAKSGRIALQTIEKEIPDIILLDIVMPDIDGYEICRILKSIEKYKDIPVIFLSALDASFNKVKAFESGGVDYITKPFSENEVKIRIDTHLKIKRYQKEIEEKKELEFNAKLEDEKHLREIMLLRSERLASLGTLSSSIAHEIRQPLQLIKIVSDSMLYSIIHDEDFRGKHIELEDKIKSISDGVDRINQIIQYLQDTVKKSGTPKKISMNINEAVKRLAYMLKGKMDVHNINCILDLGEGIKKIEFSETQFDEVIINLINNGINALDNTYKDNKRITIRTKNEKENIIIEVEDNGTGIATDIREKIFNPLFSTKNNGESMGMGLFIVANILSNNNAGIKLLDGKAHCTVFRITLKKEKSR